MADESFVKDIAVAVLIFVAVLAVLYLYAGTWPPMVSVTSESMVPHLEKGDLVFIQGLDRGSIMTYEGNDSPGYSSFGMAGDVIVYRPFGNGTPVIHRAICYVNKGDPMWYNGPAAPYAGYITKGDNNDVVDQNSNICPEQPVKLEWVVGIARFRVPFVGYLRSLLPF